LAQLRSLGTGLYLRDGSRVLYRRSDVDQWAASVLGEPITSTSQESALDHVRAAAAARRAARATPPTEPPADTAPQTARSPRGPDAA
jgi:hypothetical protein